MAEYREVRIPTILRVMPLEVTEAVMILPLYSFSFTCPVTCF